MMEKMIALQQKRRSKKGGFTLVELIVVLVILAILAALLIPALTGYIDRAKEKSAVAETRQCVMAAQTLYDESYAANNTASKPTAAAIKKLADVNGTVKDGDDLTFENSKVSKLIYTASNGKTITYTWDTTNGAQYK